MASQMVSARLLVMGEPTHVEQEEQAMTVDALVLRAIMEMVPVVLAAQEQND